MGQKPTWDELPETVAGMRQDLAELKKLFKTPILPPATPTAEPISPEELCKRLDISKPTAWAWEKKGVIRGYHLGNRRYYIWQEVMAAMQGRGQAA